MKSLKIGKVEDGRVVKDERKINVTITVGAFYREKKGSFS